MGWRGGGGRLPSGFIHRFRPPLSMHFLVWYRWLYIVYVWNWSFWYFLYFQYFFTFPRSFSESYIFYILSFIQSASCSFSCDIFALFILLKLQILFLHTLKKTMLEFTDFPFMHTVGYLKNQMCNFLFWMFYFLCMWFLTKSLLVL